MHEDGHSRDRNVIPRWRPVARAIALGETESVPGGPAPDGISRADMIAALEEALETFAEHREAPYAAEAVAAAVLAGRPAAARRAASALSGGALSPGMNRLVEACLEGRRRDPGDPPTSLERHYVQAFRAGLRAHGPRGAIAWLDLALAYASMGVYDKAARNLSIARGLMRRPTRLLLRAEARLFQHVRKPELALHALHRDLDATLADPWLLAAEIGLNRLMGKTSRHMKRARDMIERDIKPFHLSELTAAVATEEMLAGADRKSRQLFRKAVVDPAEQGLAQTAWARRRDPRIQIPKDRLKVSAEARAREALTKFDWKGAAVACGEWLADEPFASSPAAFLCTVLSVYLGDNDRALDAVQRGLNANPDHPTLVNNNGYVLARTGRLDEAMELMMAKRPWEKAMGETVACSVGTMGLIALRAGFADIGRQCYRRAFDLARQLDGGKTGDLAKRVALFYVAESRAIGSIDAEADSQMIALADSKSLSDELKELRRVLWLFTRAPEAPAILAKARSQAMDAWRKALVA